MIMKLTLEESLVIEIYKAIKADFDICHLSYNLVNSTEIGINKDGSLYIRIRAPMYDMLKFMSRQVLIYTGVGSYANELDINGSNILGRQLGNHIGYIERCISQGVSSWANKNGLTIKK